MINDHNSPYSAALHASNLTSGKHNMHMQLHGTIVTGGTSINYYYYYYYYYVHKHFNCQMTHGCYITYCLTLLRYAQHHLVNNCIIYTILMCQSCKHILPPKVKTGNFTAKVASKNAKIHTI